MKQEYIDKFHDSYLPEPITGCWLWTAGYGAGHAGGNYGHQRCGKKTLRAHRISFEIHYGPIPLGMSICHKCDVPSCVNPNHLWLGNALLNNRDKTKKGRHGNKFGTDHHSTKITEVIVLKIRSLHELGFLQKTIAEIFGLGFRHVSEIVQRRTWKHI